MKPIDFKDNPNEYKSIQKLLSNYVHASESTKFRDTALESLLDYYQADHTFMFDFRNDGLNMGIHFECCREGISPISFHNRDMMVEIFASLIEYIKKNDVFYYNLEDESINFHPEILRFFKLNNIHSFFLVPGVAEGDFEGFLAVDNPRCNLDKLTYLFLAAAGCYVEFSHEKLKKATNWKMEKLLMEREMRLRSIEEAFSNKTHTILRAVTDEFICLIDVNLVTEKESRFFLHSEDKEDLPHWSEDEDYSICILEYARKFIVPEDQHRFLEATSLAALKDYLSKHKEFIIEYDVMLEGQRKHFQGRFTINNENSNVPHMYIGIRDITKEIKRTKELQAAQESAKRDPLTGLLNRGAFETLLDELSGRPDIAIAIMDIDDFKAFNDTFGHSLGDRVLQDVANAIQSSFSNLDYVARLGGDEFCVISTNVNRAQRAILSHKLEGLRFQLLKQESPQPEITLSMGIAFYQVEQLEDPREILEKADKALYQAKRSGRNNYKFYN